MACFDVAVAGGGPAGAFAAHELARAGLRVILIDPATIRPRLEGMGERVVRLLAAKGLDGTLGAVGSPVPRKVVWAGLPGADNNERIVRRHEFDAALRQAAVDAGAELTIARVSRVIRSNLDEGVNLQLSTGLGVSAKLLIDARGRQAPAPDRQKGPQTLAIAGRVETDPQQTGTGVLSTSEGWCWSASDPVFGAWLQICVDQSDINGGGQNALHQRLERFFKQARCQNQFGPVSFQGKLLARGSGLVLAAPELTLPVIPIGDAAVAIDPLSGHGLFWALSSALSALPIILTVLDDPVQGRLLAEQFYRDRVVETFWRQARVGRDFYRLEERFATYPFWEKRMSWPDEKPAHKEVGRAYLERRVVVQNNRLKDCDVLVTPGTPDGVAFVAGVPVCELAQIAEPFPKELKHTENLPPSTAAALHWLDQQGLTARALKQLINNHSKMRETA